MAEGAPAPEENPIADPAAPAIILTPFTCGRLTVPVTAYLIEHPAGLALFDTGPGPRSEEDALIDARLRAVGVDPGQVSLILNSHLHSGHAGGNALLPAASVIVQQAEWHLAVTGTDSAYHAPDFDTGQPVITVTGAHDVFGDGSVVLVPTPGHTPGHQSARVQTSGGEVLLAGDACGRRRSPWDPLATR